MQTIEFILRAVAGFSGLIVLYAALFLLPDERGRIQNKLEDWWLDLAGAHEASGSRLVEWLKKFARTALRAFRFVYGPVRGRRFTTRLVAASMIFSTAPILFVSWATAEAIGGPIYVEGTFGRLYVPALLIILGLFPLGYVGLWMQQPRRLTARCGRWWSAPASGRSLAALVAVGTAWFAVVFVVVGFETAFDSVALGVVIVSWMLSDLAAISVTSLALRRVVHGRSIWRAIGWLAVDAGFALSLFIVPFLLISFQEPLILLAIGNVTTVIPSIGYFLVALVLVLHRALWRVFLAPLFNVFVDAPLLYRRKTLGTLGVALLGVAGFAPVESWLEQIVRLVR